MKKAIIAVVLLLLGCLLLWLVSRDFFYFPGKSAEGWSDTEKSHQWFVSQQRANRANLIFHTGLVPSHENGDTAFTYDEALAAMVFVMFEDYERARLLLDFFEKTYREQIEKYGKFTGFCDAYSSDGKWSETWAAGPNAWLLIAINYYTYETADRKYLPLAEVLAGWLISLQSLEGGIIGGYYGDGEPMTWISTEHNFDCYAALRDLGILTGEEKYLKAAKEIKIWFEKDPWDEKAKRFYMGRKKYNPNYATDLSSWAVLSLGNRYGVTLDFAIDKSLNKQLYKVKNVEIEGFDFGSAYDVSPFPDKDAVWLEGTAQMVLAFDRAGRIQEKKHFLKELDKALTPSEAHKFTGGLPYATNEGTPAYSSWLMQDKPLCISSTAWYVFAKKNFNPFSMDQKENVNNKVIDDLLYKPDFQFVPVIDDFEYSDVEFQSAYLKQLIFSNHAKVEISLETGIAKNGTSSMKFDFKPEPSAKLSTSFIRRPFMLPQDWSGYKRLKFRVSLASGDLMLRLKLKDKQGEPFESREIVLKKDGWREVAVELENGLRRGPEYPNYGDKKFDLDGVREIGFEIITKSTDKDTVFYIDDITLE